MHTRYGCLIMIIINKRPIAFVIIIIAYGIFFIKNRRTHLVVQLRQLKQH